MDDELIVAKGSGTMVTVDGKELPCPLWLCGGFMLCIIMQ